MQAGELLVEGGDAVPDGAVVEHESSGAQKQASADLLAALEWRADTDITGSTAEELAAAQAEVAKDIGW